MFEKGDIKKYVEDPNVKCMVPNPRGSGGGSVTHKPPTICPCPNCPNTTKLPYSVTTDTLTKIKNHSDYDKLPKTNTKILKIEDSKFYNENIDIDKTDYYFSNAIARSSKTMSDCKAARESNSKN